MLFWFVLKLLSDLPLPTSYPSLATSSMKLTKRQAILALGVVVLVGGAIALIFFNLRPKANNAAQIKLTVWGVEDKQTVFNILSSYPYAQVAYTQLDPANYGATVLSALAAGTGPDVLEIGNRSLPRWQPVLAPLPATYAAQFGTLQIQNSFPDVVSQNFITSGSLYALPLSIDTLALIYNKDLFNSANIAYPPKTWDDFQADVVKLRAVNAQGQLTRAGAAIGGSEASVPNAPDILSLLMLQNGTKMVTDDFSSAVFASAGGGSASGGGGSAGLLAFNYYLQFANASGPYYTWNEMMGNAFDNFAAGNAAMVFAYQSDLATIKKKAPFLNIGIAQMPQPTGATVAINYPRYQGFAATKAGQSAAAWYFILYMTTTDAIEKMYVSATGQPPALRQEIQADMNDPNLAVFASQTLAAKSWYEADDAKVDAIFNTAIQNVLNGQANSTRAFGQAQEAVSGLMHQ
jgi:ABC-type glycerol-3-phosphate transport system substrate-binding protein